jgi:hypothetical protein
MLRLRPEAEGEVLATLSLPYGSPEPGSVYDHAWASIHTSPPWEATGRPALVRHAYGEGVALYCAAALEAEASDANTRLLDALIRSLLVDPAYTAEAHPSVWMNVMHQPEARRMLVGFLNAQRDTPPVPAPPVAFTLRPPEGARFTELVRLPDETPAPFTLDENGVLHATTGTLEIFDLYRVTY